MTAKRSKLSAPAIPLPKCPTGIHGLDEITGGGLPRGRPTLVCGGAGCGKTLLAAEFVVRGARQFGEATRARIWQHRDLAVTRLGTNSGVGTEQALAAAKRYRPCVPEDAPFIV